MALAKVHSSSGPPSQPVNVRVVDQTSDSITLMWDEPSDLGGRTDTVYVLWYREVDSTTIVEARRVNTTTGTITGMYVAIALQLKSIAFTCHPFMQTNAQS